MGGLGMTANLTLVHVTIIVSHVSDPELTTAPIAHTTHTGKTMVSTVKMDVPVTKNGLDTTARFMKDLVILNANMDATDHTTPIVLIATSTLTGMPQ